MTKIAGESINSFSFTVMLRESGASSNPRATGFALTVPESWDGGYWIARTSRAMTTARFRWWRQDTRWTR
jgi:hypothetical protein